MIPSLLTDTVTFDIDRAVHYALLWGLEGVELRSVGGVHDRVPFVNEAKIKLRLFESELPVVGVDPGTFVGTVDDRVDRMNDLAQFDETLQFCKRIGCSRVVVSSFRDPPGGDAGEAPMTESGKESLERAVDALRTSAAKAERAGVTVCVLNEEGYLAPNGRRLAQLLDAVDSDALAAAWSPAEALLAGEDPAEGLRALGGRVGLVRCRNGVVKGNGWEPRSIDTGAIDWLEQILLLKASGFDGPLSLEVETDSHARAGLRDATALIRLLRAAEQQGDEGRQ